MLLEAGNNFVQIEIDHLENGTDTISVKVDRKQILTTGQEAMRKFLLKMQVFKSTADVQQAKEMFGGYSRVNDKFMKIR